MTEKQPWNRNESSTSAETGHATPPLSAGSVEFARHPPESAAAAAGRFPPAVMRLRRLQIRAVVVGVLAGITWLVGLSMPQVWLAYLGAGIVLVAWVSILILGIGAHVLSRRARHDN